MVEGATVKWTKERPKTEGWYWCWSIVNPDPFIRHFSEIGGDIISDATGIDVTSSTFDDMEFAGPIEEPVK